MELVNKTPYASECMLLQDREGRDLLVVVVKCTYSTDQPDKLRLAEQQIPIQHEDVFHGDPGGSSLKQASDVAPFKPSTDVVLLGHAYPPAGGAGEFDVSVKVGTLAKTCRIFGARRWKKSQNSITPTASGPAQKIPLLYERAFGGKDLSSPDPTQHEVENRNPVGCGLLARQSALDPEQIILPQIEDPAQLIRTPADRPKPAGFGFIGRNWLPRATHAGRYDKNWKEQRFPLVPLDFNDLYFNGAHPDLISARHLQGNEPVELTNVSGRGPIRFKLPGGRPAVAVISTDLEWTPLEPMLDTLILEPDENRVVMCWRSSMVVHRRLHKFACIRVAQDG